MENRLGKEVVFVGRDVTCGGKLNSSADGLKDDGGNVKGGTGADFFLTLVRPSFSFSIESWACALLSFKTSKLGKFSLFLPTTAIACLVVIFTTSLPFTTYLK